MNTTDKVIILGGGIGGLCASIAFSQRGIETVLYEKAAEFGESGAGIQVWVKGMRALDELGLGERVRLAGAEVHRHQFFNDKNEPLYVGPLQEFAKTYGVSMPVMIRRTCLIESLVSGVDLSTVRFNRRARSVTQDRDKVTVHFDDGTSDSAPFLVAADGINSMVRQSLFPQAQVRTASYRYTRGLVRLPAPFGVNNFTMFFGKGNRIAVGDCGQDYMYWLVGLKNPVVGLNEPNDKLKVDLLDRFRSFPKGVAEVIDATPASALIHHTVRDVVGMQTYGKGRIAILGDAAHATTPNLGRGSGEAMLDALVLAELISRTNLSDQSATEQLIADYTRRRKPEADELRDSSWSVGNITSWEGTVSVKSRDLVMKTFVGQKQIKNIREQFKIASAPSLA